MSAAVVAAPASAVPCTVPGLTNGTAYKFTAKAVNSIGTSVASGPSDSVTPASVPGAPTVASVTAGNGSATLTLTPPASNGGAPITSYSVISTPDGKTGTCTVSPPACTVTGLTNGKAYTFKVAAINAIGKGPDSAASSSVTPAPTKPDAPKIVEIGAGNGEVAVYFAPPGSDGGAPITSYTVTTSPSTKPVTCTNSPCMVTGLTNGTNYSFMLTATNIAGTSDPSSAASATPTATKPDAPAINSVTGGNGSVTISVKPPANDGGSPVTGYSVVSDDGKTGTCTVTPASCTVSGLTNGKPYTFKVSAINAKGTSNPSAASASVTPTATTVPGVPGISKVTPGDGSVKIELTAPVSDGGAPITSYTVISDDGKTGSCTVSPAACSIGGLTNGKAYVFKISAVNSVGAGSPASTSNITPTTAPGAPTISKVTPGNKSATVAFTPPASNGGAEIINYLVVSEPDGKTATCNASPCTVEGLANGKAYNFKVSAINSAGTGPSSSASASVTPVTVPDAPTIKSVTAGDGTVKVEITPPAWNGGSEITSYSVVSEPDGKTGTCTVSPAVCTVGGLTNGKAYKFKVTAANSAGPGPASIASSGVTPAASPGAPTITNVTGGNGMAKVEFTPPASNGGAEITIYTAVSEPDGKTATCKASPCTVEGLTNGKAYKFKVTATNSAGTGPASSASVGVTPATVPGAPSISKVTPSSGSVKVEFTPPASNGGSEITLYTVVSEPDGKTATCTASPCNVEGLTNGKTYTFKVTAKNAAGIGPASSASSSVTPAAVPGAPAIRSVTVGSGLAVVEFTPPAATGGAEITGYTVTSAPGGVTANCTSSPCTIRGLTNGTAYTFTVTATNRAGTSAPSAASASSTPGLPVLTATGVVTPSTFWQAGQTLLFTITVKNVGRTTATDIKIAEPRLPGLTCNSSTLAVGASMDCKSTTSSTTADLSAGKITVNPKVTYTYAGLQTGAN